MESTITSKKRLNKKINLERIPEEDLLNARICDLSLKIEGTWLQSCVEELYKELNLKGLKFRPPCYLADEWLTPEDEPIIGIPFYLADDTLIRLEKKMMLEAEGSTKDWCMKLLRHETGHAISYAYKLNKRRKWQEVFGSPKEEYDDTYRFRPYSKSFVRHLEDYYAQYHPDEDFSETFAVWLTPNLDWQNQYKGWNAIGKLNFVDKLINEIKDKDPIVKKGNKYWQASKLRVTLRNHYRKKKHFLAEDFPDFHDTNLKRIFVEKSEESKDLPSAVDIIKRHRVYILKSIANWTGEKKYITNDLLKVIQKRCGELKLLAADTESVAALKVSTYITTMVMNYRYTGRFRGKE